MLRDGCSVLDSNFLILSLFFFFFAILDIPVCNCMKYLFLNYNRMKKTLNSIPVLKEEFNNQRNAGEHISRK